MMAACGMGCVYAKWLPEDSVKVQKPGAHCRVWGKSVLVSQRICVCRESKACMLEALRNNKQISKELPKTSVSLKKQKRIFSFPFYPIRAASPLVGAACILGVSSRVSL